MNSNSRRFSVIVLLIISLAFVGGAIFLAWQLQQEQAPDDTSAAGFGDDVFRGQFFDVTAMLVGNPCEVFLSNDIFRNHTNQFVAPLAGTLDETIEHIYVDGSPDPSGILSKSCEYQFAGNKSIMLHFYTYDQDSFIDDSFDDLQQRINGRLLGEPNLEWGFLSADVTFHFRPLPDNSGCGTTIFHFQNDFEVVFMEYEGWGNDCESMMDLNRGLTEVVSTKIIYLMSPFLLPEYSNLFN